MKRAVIVFSGFNPRAVIAFLRTLEDCKVAYAVIASSPDDPIFKTTYKQKVLATRKVKILDLDDIKDQIKHVTSRLPADDYLIAPSTEALNRFLLAHATVFTNLDCHIPLVNSDDYSLVSDKESFGALCERKGFDVPKAFDDLTNMPFPCVAKPKQYLASDGQSLSPVLLFNKQDFERLASTYSTDDFYFQEYIKGESYYLLYYFDKNGGVQKYSQQNLIQQPDGKSIVAATSTTLHNEEISLQYEELLSGIHFRGLIMVEVKHFNDRYYMIEANPRFWGPSQLFVDAGSNLFKAFLHDWGVLDTPPEFKDDMEVRYYWFGGIVQTLAAHGKLAYHGYSSDQHASEIGDWLNSDIYNRSDTREVFVDETNI